MMPHYSAGVAAGKRSESKTRPVAEGRRTGYNREWRLVLGVDGAVYRQLPVRDGDGRKRDVRRRRVDRLVDAALHAVKDAVNHRLIDFEHAKRGPRDLQLDVAAAADVRHNVDFGVGRQRVDLDLPVHVDGAVAQRDLYILNREGLAGIRLCLGERRLYRRRQLRLGE